MLLILNESNNGISNAHKGTRTRDFEFALRGVQDPGLYYCRN